MLQFELSSRAGVKLGPVIDADGRGHSRGIKRPRTARFTVGAGNSMRDVLRLTDQVLVRCYDVDNAGNRTLWHCGPITSYERTDGDQGLTVSVGSTGPEVALNRRLVRRGDSSAGGVIIQTGGARDDLIRSLNNDISGAGGGGTSGNYDIFTVANTNIRFVWTGGTGIGSLPTYKPELYQPASDVLAALSSGLDGPDWHVYPFEPSTDTWGLWYGGLATGSAYGVIGAGPNMGALKPAAIFEFGGRLQGGRANVTGYTEIIDPTNIVNSVYSLPPTSADYGVPSLAILNQQDGTSISQHGLLEAVIPDGLTDATLRTQLLLDHLAVRKDPRRTIAFTVAVDPDPGNTDLTTRSTVPRLGPDFDFGDIVPFRAWERYPVRADDGAILDTAEVLVVDVQMRVYDVDVSEDAHGRRQMTLVTVAE